jgi:phosphotransferase system  glucose/maltose/N-acetylglucosamine-specific IIC component
MIFIIPGVIIFVVAFVITFVVKEKKNINKHKKNQNYETEKKRAKKRNS